MRENKTRKKIATILSQLRTSYGYKIYKIYVEAFGKISKRTIYYNLNKGVETGEFVVADVRSKEGNFTWGNKTQRVYYTLGPRAKLSGISNEAINKIQRHSPGKIEIDWKNIIKEKLDKLKKEREKINSRKKKIKFLNKVESFKDWIIEKLGKTSSKDYTEVLKDITSDL